MKYHQPVALNHQKLHLFCTLIRKKKKKNTLQFLLKLQDQTGNPEVEENVDKNWVIGKTQNSQYLWSEKQMKK